MNINLNGKFIIAEDNNKLTQKNYSPYHSHLADFIRFLAFDEQQNNRNFRIIIVKYNPKMATLTF